ncbi:MAG: hypothetical protein K1W37_22175 [Lachnospiraceae bacterium]
MEGCRKVFIRYCHPKQMTAAFCRNEQSVGCVFLQTMDAVIQKPSESALLLMRMRQK